MRFQSWQLEVLVDGAPLEEHTIDGRVCVQAQPGNEFGVRARYLESGQYFFLELLLDGNPVTGLKWIDAVGDTITPQTEYTFSAWEKIVEGHRTRQRLCFEKTDAASEESRPAGQRSWDRGRFTLRVHKAHRDVCTRDSMSRDFKADLSKKKMDMDESTMVKNGLSTSVGTGEIRFEKLGGFRAGQVIVRQDPAREVLCELEIFFRDSFFMALNDDTCCDGKCAAKAASSVRGACLRRPFSRSICRWFGLPLHRSAAAALAQRSDGLASALRRTRERGPQWQRQGGHDARAARRDARDGGGSAPQATGGRGGHLPVQQRRGGRGRQAAARRRLEQQRRDRRRLSSRPRGRA